MGQSFATTGSFTMPWGDPHSDLTAPVPSHHYPPLYPMYLASFYKVLGFSQATTDAASIASSLLALAVVYLCTRDLYGRTRALIATAVVAVCPLLVQVTGQDYSENLVLASSPRPSGRSCAASTGPGTSSPPASLPASATSRSPRWGRSSWWLAWGVSRGACTGRAGKCCATRRTLRPSPASGRSPPPGWRATSCSSARGRRAPTSTMPCNWPSPIRCGGATSPS
ncbi:MAG: glycosyltransferase family 39 protein [Thermoplasmatota archaeon]